MYGQSEVRSEVKSGHFADLLGDVHFTKADIPYAGRDVSFVPIADIPQFIRSVGSKSQTLSMVLRVDSLRWIAPI